jgi:hypothetical protein
MDVQAKNVLTLSYTYTNQAGAVIPLTGNTGVVLLLRSRAGGLETLPATVDDVPGGRVSGQVRLEPGRRYEWQFKVNMPGDPLYSPRNASFELHALPNLDS